MSIDPTDAAPTTATTSTTTTTTTSNSSTASLPSIVGAEEEEESTLVEISASSSSSSPTTVSSLSPSSRTTSSTTTAAAGDDGPPESQQHPEDATAAHESKQATTTKAAMTISHDDDASTGCLDYSEASTVALVADLTPEQQQQQQPTLAPVAAHVATDLPVESSRNLIPIQSSSSLSTPSSSEEYDESVNNTSSTEGALNVSSSNINNNYNSTAIGNNTTVPESELSAIESALPSGSSKVTLVTSTPENSPTSSGGSKPDEQQRQAPIEIVQIFPPTAKTLSSSLATSSSSSSSSSTPSSGSPPSSAASVPSSTSSSPSASPLAVDQQQPSTTIAVSPPQAQVQSEVAPASKMDDSAIAGEPEVPDLVVMTAAKSDLQQQEEPSSKFVYHNRTSSSSPQLLQSSLKKYKMGERSSESARRVSFPQDAQLITGYLEPIDPWACVTIISVPELIELYRKSCTKHFTEPLPAVTEHLTKLDLAANQRIPLLSLKDQNLSHGSCEALEEIFKRVQYRSINLSNAGLDDTSASVLFDMIEYYEAANELDISDNLAMTNKSWLAAINMVKKSQALNVLTTRGPGISEHLAMSLAKALNTSALHTLRLEHCELTQRPLATLCNLLKRNTVLRELSLAHNQLTCDDAKNIANLLRSNYYIQLLDISHNNIGDKGVEYIVTALIDQSIYFKTMQETKRKSEFSFADLSSSLHNINSNKHYFPHPYGGKTSQQRLCQPKPPPEQPKLSESSLSAAMSPTPMAMAAAGPPVTDDTPRTPPPTPALPVVRTPSGEALLSSGNLSPPVETQEEEPPPGPPVTAATTAETALEESSDLLLHEKSTNNDSGLNSSVSSEADQTNSDSSGNLGAVSTEVQQSKEEPSEVATEEGKCDTTSDISGDNLVDSGLVVCDHPEDSSRTDSASDVEVCTGDAVGEKQTLELAFDLSGDEVDVKAPKKARLAKQDSILSEFEASMPELRLKTTEIPKKQSAPSGKAEEPMDEDTPEVCTDYDDSNLKIVEENLLVDRSINASSRKQNDTKEVEEEDRSNLTDNDDSAPVTPLATHKKDELQLLLEKSKQREEQDEESIDHPPLLKTTLPIIETVPSSVPISPEVVTSMSVPENLGSIPLKIVESDKPLSRSLDSAGSADFGSPFLGGSQPPTFPQERSFSSESLNSETSVDSNDSKSSLKIIESKFAARNGTLERQQSNAANRDAQQADQSPNTPCGLQVLVLWNNEITRHAAQTFSDLIENTSTLEILNVGCNLLCNDFVANIKSSLKVNSSVTSLGLQGAHLSDNGAKVMAEVIEFGGNATLQRIDLRNNNILATGLEHLNDAMKSNKTVTRIDLDDVPRRVVENSIDIGPEYARLLNSIRSQCERNKNPQEPSEPISTSIKRLRGSHLNSRKISLTCSSIRVAPSGTTAGEKHHHHLLDPAKKTGGRLRSPLPSPIPSPIASPVPSPSRNRFQVTRVGESAGGSTSSLTSINATSNTSTSPSPSSTGSSPTLFFAANSRFRVVTVEEPASAPPSTSSSSVPNYPMGKLSSSSISPSPLVTSGISRMPPSSSSSAPALSSFVSSPKLTSSPILQQSVATNTNLSPVLVTSPQPTIVQSPQPSLQQQQPLPTTPASVPPTPKSKHTRLPSTSSSTLNDSVISSTSIESPDLEVKRFMTGGGTASTGHHTRTHSSTTMDDSCCSSISSSIDSIDNVHFSSNNNNNNNTSISSTDESFDLIVSSPSSSSIGSVSTAPLVKSTASQQADITLIPQQKQQPQHQQLQQKQQPTNPTNSKESTSLLGVNVNLLKVKNNSLSSLEMSTSSQESLLYDVQDLSSVSSISSLSGGCVGGSSSLVGGLAVGPAVRLTTAAASSGNSNENTLTSIHSLDRDVRPAAGKSSEKPPRVRKTSWIASIGNHPKTDTSSTGSSGGNSSGSGYSPAIEKLLSIFNPGNLFSSNKSSPPSSECGTASTGGGTSSAAAAAKENTSSSQPPSRKESPMGGLFAWTTKSSKDEEKVLKVNVSPENTITPQQQQQQHQVGISQHSPQLPAFSVDNISSQLKAEIKENISPENTITNKLLVNPPPSSQAMTTPVQAPVATAAGSPHPKVIFHLGGDYEDSEDDIDTLTSKFGGGGTTGVINPLSHPPVSILGTSTGSTTTNSSGISIGSSTMAEGSPIPASGVAILQTSHLGQLARDSLTTMFKNSSLTSQDSIRSMDSLAEMAETQIPSHQHQHPPPHQHPQPDDTQAQ